MTQPPPPGGQPEGQAGSPGARPEPSPGGPPPPGWVAPGPAAGAYPPAPSPYAPAPGGYPSGAHAPGAYAPGGYAPGGYAPGGYAPGYAPAPAYLPPVHKPGVVALRPLTLGDMFDGAFKTIRHNPRSMLGLAALVLTGFMLLPALGTLVVAATGDLSVATGEDFLTEDVSGGSDWLAYAATYAGALFGFLATIVLNGMIVHVVAEAVLGRKSSIGEAWAVARGSLLRLLGLTLLNAVVLLVLIAVPVALGVALGLTVSTGVGVAAGLLLAPFVIVAGVFIQIRCLQLAAPALVLERLGVVAAIRRSYQLSARQFWRILGIVVVTGLVVGLVGQVATVPFAVAGVIAPVMMTNGVAAALVVAFSSYLTQVLVGVITTPFSSAVVALQYVDQRIRKEGYDVELIAASQQPGRPVA